jgi:predicted DNA repair protein MutK
MASGILSVLDDVGALMDDVALASKVATRKTAGILGDDLAVNAEKATGFLASRELPVLWAISKGSFINKLIIVPVSLLLTAFLPAAIKVILVLGAFYLAYEAAEKIVEFFFHHKKADEVIEQAEQERDAEKIKIKSAITTDFILSVEIVIIALGAVLEETLITQIITVSFVALIATVGVYGLVALIVRMDDIGYRLIRRSKDKGVWATIGHLLVKALPYIIKVIGVIGTIALLLVSGGIFVHQFNFLHGDSFSQWPTIVVEFLAGLVAGLILVVLIKTGKRIFKRNAGS